MKKTRQGNFITGALLISLGGLFAKVLGALYRIPLTNILGSYGMGLYQLVFPPYILLLTFSQAGVPVALSKLVAEKTQCGALDERSKVFHFCLRCLIFSGVVGAVVMAVLGFSIAKAQGNVDAPYSFLIVAPALLFVPATNVLKGYFQGKMNMLPSSATTVIEQLVKLIVGLSLAKYFMPDVVKAVYGTVFAITVSEFTSLVIMTVVYLRHGKKENLLRVNVGESKDVAKEVFSLALPVAIGSFVMQLSQMIDSVMVVNLLGEGDATNLYGLWTGPVNSMLGLPIALSAGVAVSALPAISKTIAEKNEEKLCLAYNSAIKLTLIISLPTALGMIVLSRPIIAMLYSALPPAEIQISANLLSLSGISIVFLSCYQTVISVLQATSKPYVSAIVFSFAIVVKAVANLILLPVPQINIYGAAISETLCYLFASISVIIYSATKLHLKLNLNDCVFKPLSGSMVMTLCLTVLITFAGDFVLTTTGTVVAIIISAIVYFSSLVALKVFDEREIATLPLPLRGKQ